MLGQNNAAAYISAQQNAVGFQNAYRSETALQPQAPLLEHFGASLTQNLAVAHETLKTLQALDERLFGPFPLPDEGGLAARPKASHASGLLKDAHDDLQDALVQIASLVGRINARL